MQAFKDFSGRDVRLTEERKEHFQTRLIKAGLLDKLEETIFEPDFVIQSISDKQAAISYKFYRGTRAGNKYLCAVIKYDSDDAFVLRHIRAIK